MTNIEFSISSKAGGLALDCGRVLEFRGIPSATYSQLDRLLWHKLEQNNRGLR